MKKTKAASLEDTQEQQQLKWIAPATRRENNVDFLHYFKQNVWEEIPINSRKMDLTSLFSLKKNRKTCFKKNIL